MEEGTGRERHHHAEADSRPIEHAYFAHTLKGSRYLGSPNFMIPLVAGVDLNQQPLGYEPSEDRDFNNLQDAGGARSHCKERKGTVIGHLMDTRDLKFLRASNKTQLGVESSSSSPIQGSGQH